MDLGDVDDLVALAASSSAAQADPIEDRDPELDDLHMLVQQGRPERAPRKHEQRSWQLLEKARSTKANLALERKLEAESLEKRAALDALDAVRHAFPSIAAVVGLPYTNHGSAGLTHKRAQVLSVLAVRPRLAGSAASSAGLLTQKRAVALVARSVLTVQAALRGELVGPSAAAGRPAIPRGSQRCQGYLVHRLAMGRVIPEDEKYCFD